MNKEEFEQFKKRFAYDYSHNNGHVQQLIDLVEKQQKEIDMLNSAVKQDDETKQRYAGEINELQKAAIGAYTGWRVGYDVAGPMSNLYRTLDKYVDVHMLVVAEKRRVKKLEEDRLKAWDQ